VKNPFPGMQFPIATTLFFQTVVVRWPFFELVIGDTVNCDVLFSASFLSADGPLQLGLQEHKFPPCSPLPRNKV